jgi:hypothetical protein
MRYWRRVFLIARSEAWRSAQNRLGSPMALTLLTLGAAVVLAFVGLWSELWPLFWTAVGGLLVIGGYWVAAVAVQLWRIPPKWHARKCAETRRLNSEIAKRSAVYAASINGTYPDMTIRELFLTLDPDALDAPRWIAVGQAVKDNFAVGRLDCWGRPIKSHDWVDEMWGWPEQSALEKIDPSYWKCAQLSYSFVCSEDRYQPHTSPDLNSGLTTYKDLQVNRAQAVAQDWSEIERFRTARAPHFLSREEGD